MFRDCDQSNGSKEQLQTTTVGDGEEAQMWKVTVRWRRTSTIWSVTWHKTFKKYNSSVGWSFEYWLEVDFGSRNWTGTRKIKKLNQGEVQIVHSASSEKSLVEFPIHIDIVLELILWSYKCKWRVIKFHATRNSLQLLTRRTPYRT